MHAILVNGSMINNTAEVKKHGTRARLDISALSIRERKTVRVVSNGKIVHIMRAISWMGISKVKASITLLT